MKTLSKLIGIGALALVAASACDKSGSTGQDPDLGGSDMTGGGGGADLGSGGEDLANGGLTLTQITPGSVSTAGGTALTLTGSGFLAGATVSIGGTALGSPTIASPTQITGQAPAKPGACGQVPVEVMNQGGTKVTASNLLSYFIPTANLASSSFMDQAVTGATLVSEVYGTAVVDFSGDNNNDFVAVVSGTVGSPNGKLALFQNNGSGSFAAAPTLLDVGPIPRTVSVGDLNGDGRPDAVVSNLGADLAAGSFSVLLGKAGGGFNPATTISLTDIRQVKPRAALLADMNGDGSLDLLAADESNGKVYIVRGLGNGTFDVANAKGYALANLAPQGYALAVGLFNSDNRLDVAVVDGTSGRNSISVFLNDGTGALGAATNVAVGTNPRGVASADFDGDGKADLAVTNLGSDTVSILRGSGTGTFTAGAAPGTGNGPRAVSVADLNCDGKPDLVVSLDTGNAVAVMLNESTGANSFTFRRQTFTTGTGSAPQMLSTGDINNDGRADIVVGETGSSAVSLLRSGLQ